MIFPQASTIYTAEEVPDAYVGRYYVLLIDRGQTENYQKAN